MSELKTRPTAEPVSDFLDRIPDEARRRDCQALVSLMTQVTGEPPVMWGASIVGFAQYHYRYASGQEADWPIIGFSPRKNDLTVYVSAGFASSGELLGKLGRHKTGKACLYLKKLADVDMEVLRQLLVEGVTAMASQRVGGPAES